MRKPICRQDEALLRLELIVAKLKSDGQVFLPAERELCDLVGTSRKTLRTALDELEKRGSLEAGPRGRVISANATAPSKGTVIFVAGGSDWIILPAWNRLWTHFEKLAREMGWNCRLVLREGRTTLFSAKDFDGADFIIYSGISHAYEKEFVRFCRRTE
jgi:hypothetical protein